MNARSIINQLMIYVQYNTFFRIQLLRVTRVGDWTFVCRLVVVVVAGSEGNRRLI